MYEREGIATRVVNVFPDECWADYPEVYDDPNEKANTPFEKKWTEVEFNVNPWHYLHRVDVLSGIGRFGILVLGIDDGRSLDQPLVGITNSGEVRSNKKESQLTYLRAYDESCVKIKSTIKEKTSRLRGMPEFYDINLINDPDSEARFAATLPNETSTQTVHWTRVMHVADNRRSSEVFGTPRQKPVINRIADLRKVLGGSAEMFWQGGFPGLSLEQFPNIEDAEDLDLPMIREQLFNYMNRLQRYIAVQGMQVKSLAPQVADPSKHVEQQLRMICATIKVPMRIFLGSESGSLASDQDKINWNKRIRNRQSTYLDPMLVKPFILRLQMAGVLPQSKDKRFFTDWVDLNAITETDKADVALKRSQALLQYVTSGGEVVVPTLEFLTYFMQFPRSQAEAIVEALNRKEKKTEKVWNKKQEGAAPSRGPQKSPQRGARRPARNSLGSSA